MAVGRPRDALRAALVDDTWSERTKSTYYAGLQRLFNAEAAGCSIDAQQTAEALLAESTRPNGTVNVSRFRRIADEAIQAAYKEKVLRRRAAQEA